MTSAPPARSSAHTSVNSAAVTGRLEINPPREPDSSLWFSDREIGSPRSKVAHLYSADDYRRELARVERKLYWLSFISIALAVIAVAAVVILILM